MRFLVFLLLLLFSLQALSDSSTEETTSTSTSTTSTSTTSTSSTTTTLEETSTTTTATPSPTPTCPVCTPCFDCSTNPSLCQQGTCKADRTCECHPGYSGDVCSQKTCISSPLNSNTTTRLPGEKCPCSAGWTGFDCQTCISDSVCSFAGSNAVCDASGYTIQKSQGWCVIETPIFHSLLNGIPYSSLTHNEETNEAFFQVVAKLDGDDGYTEQFYCEFKECLMSPERDNATYMRCENTKCYCYPNSFACGGGAFVDISPVLSLIDNPSSFNCSSNGTCQFNEENLYSLVGLIQLTCTRGECGVPRTFPLFPDITTLDSSLVGGVIGGVAGAFVAAVAALSLFVFFQKRALMKLITSENIDEAYLNSLLLQNHVTSFAFRGISYEIKTKKTKTLVVSQVSGCLEAGQMMAIMGSSGAGKTTVLDIIAQKTKTGVVGGETFVNGEKCSKSHFKRISGYVDQEDTLLASLTVRESIMYAARLRLPSSTSFQDKMRRVQAVMKALRIDHVAERRVGSKGARGISGGEKRRVTIACELVATPAILFLDEPTSGLDSFSALAVVEALKKLATSSKMMVIMTIHQPRSNLFSQFDKLLLLTKGKMFYSGSLSQSTSHFEQIGFPCPPAYNPADYYIDIASTSSVDSETSRDQPDPSVEIELGKIEEGSAASPPPLADRQKELVDKFASSGSFKELEDSLASLSTPKSGDGPSLQSKKPEKPLNTFQQIYVLSSRAFVNFHRDPLLMYTQYGVSVVLACLIGGFFWQVTNSLAGLQNRLGYIFFTLAIFGFGCISSLETFAADRMVFTAERSNGYYGAFSFFVSKMLFDNVPLRLVPPIIFTCISYFMVGFQNSPDLFFKFMLVLVLFNLTAGSFAILFGSVFKNKGVANLTASLAMLFSLLFSGFLINKDDMPPALVWIQYLSFFNYAFEAIAVNEFANIIIVDEAAGITINVQANVIIELFGFSPDAFWRDVGILAGFYVFYLILSFLALKFLIKEKR